MSGLPRCTDKDKGVCPFVCVCVYLSHLHLSFWPASICPVTALDVPTFCDRRSCSRSHWQCPLSRRHPLLGPLPRSLPVSFDWHCVRACCFHRSQFYTICRKLCQSESRRWLRLTNFGNNRATITTTITTTATTINGYVSPCNGLDVPLSIVCPKLSIGNCRQVAELTVPGCGFIEAGHDVVVLFVQLAIYYKQIYVCAQLLSVYWTRVICAFS